MHNAFNGGCYGVSSKTAILFIVAAEYMAVPEPAIRTKYGNVGPLCNGFVFLEKFLKPLGPLCGGFIFLGNISMLANVGHLCNFIV